MLTLDNESTRAADRLAPEMNIFDMNDLDNPSSCTNLPKPVASTIADWVDTESSINQEIRDKMTQFM